ncbi:MAG TPA: hypothetical protein DDX92_03455 [Flavobacteriales bacterium]|jgi:hypothetical protein|nr:hypothetical protein [Flavobacteriales bacterium]
MAQRYINYKLKQQVLFWSACLFLWGSALSQKKWEDIGLNLSPYRNVRSVYVDTLEDQLIFGGVYLDEVNGQSSCSVFKWSPSGGEEILAPYDLNEMPVWLATDVFKIGDSIIALGANSLAIYTDSVWHTVTEHDQSSLQQIIPYPYGEGYLIANGYSRTLMGDTVGALMYWDGDSLYEEFESISDYIGEGGIYDMIDYQGELYVSGNGSTLSGGIMNEILRWTGTEWTDVDGGITDVSKMGGVNAMVEYQGDLYFGGIFTQADHSGESHIARWNGSEWLPVGGGVYPHPLSQSIFSMVVHDGYLYVAGQFDEVGGVPARSVARWDGTEWCGCGSYIDGGINEIFFYHDTLYIAGAFNYIDGDSIAKVARFIGDDFADTCGTTLYTALEDVLGGSKTEFIKTYPNPAVEEVYLELPLSSGEGITVEVFTVAGVLLETQRLRAQGKDGLRVNSEGWSAGWHLLRIQTKDKEYGATVYKL